MKQYFKEQLKVCMKFDIMLVLIKWIYSPLQVSDLPGLKLR